MRLALRMSPRASFFSTSSEATTVTVRHDILSEQEWAALRQHLGLSLRQGEIVKGLFYGNSRKEIARKLAIQPHAVGAEMSQLYREFGVSNRLELILHVLASLRECSEENDRFVH